MISVIIPVYNSQKFLRQCLQSVLTQEFPDFEVVAVDDGSTDGSGAILDELASTHPRLRVIHTMNAGVSAARNVGIEACKGHWLTFVDADDVLLPGALSTMYNVVGDADVAMFRWQTGTDLDEVNLTASAGRNRKHHKAYSLTGFQAAEAVLYRYRGLEPVPWAKIYRRELFKDIRFAEGIRYEDVELAHRLLLKAWSVTVSDKIVYFYRNHPQSFMQTWNESRLDILRVTDGIVEWCTENCPRLLPAACDRRFSAYFNIYLLAVKHGRKPLASTCWEVIKQYRAKVLFLRHTRLKNRLGALLSYAGPHTIRFVKRIIPIRGKTKYTTV